MASSARIDELLKKFEENPRRYFAPLANEYRKAGDVERAIQLCREHLPQQPGHMSGHIVFGQALFEAQQFDESRQVFTAALALDPENLIALRHLGDIARGEGDLGAARDWYKRVLDADPRNEEIAAQLASLDSGEAMTPASDGREASGDTVEFMSAAADAGTLDITPIELSADAFAAPTSGGTADPAPASSHEPGAPARAADEEDASREMSAMDFALASFGDAPASGGGAAPPAPVEETRAADDGFPSLDIEPAPGDHATDRTPSPAAEGFESGFATEGLDLGGDMELTPAHGASALVSRAEPPDDSMTFGFGDETRAADDHPSLELAEEVAAAPEAAAAEPRGTPAPAAMDDRPLGLESMEFVPPSRASEPDPMAGHLLRDEEPAAATPAAFVTETMAELYLQQGFRDEALSVYRQLLAQTPGDENLRDRVAQLESGSRSSVSVAGISDSVIEAARQRRAAPAPAKTAREFFASLANRRPAPAAGWSAPEGGEAIDGDEAIAEDAASAASAATSGASPEGAVDEFGFPVDFETTGAVVHRDLGQPRLEEEPQGVNLGEALIGAGLDLDEADQLPPSAAIEPAMLDFAADAGSSVEQPAPTSEVASEFEVVPVDEMTGDRYGQTEEPEGEATDFPAPPGMSRLSGPVDTLFGDGAVPTQDDAAASALASAFGGEEETPDAASYGAHANGAAAQGAVDRPATGAQGRTTGGQSAATRPAASELSLDHVFRDAPRRTGEKRREAPAFSFDQFFADGGGASARGAAEPSSAPTPADGTPAGGDERDIEQFNAWLEGLKKR